MNVKRIVELVNELDKTLLDKNRLSIILLLYLRKKLNFKYLTTILDMGSGTFAKHAEKLKKEGYIKIEKKIVKRRPYTEYKITDEGERKIKEHLRTLKEIIKLVD